VPERVEPPGGTAEHNSDNRGIAVPVNFNAHSTGDGWQSRASKQAAQ
jgi:hypothetical protein